MVNKYAPVEITELPALQDSWGYKSNTRTDYFQVLRHQYLKSDFCIEESADLGIIVSALQVIEVVLGIVHIATVAEGYIFILQAALIPVKAGQIICSVCISIALWICAVWLIKNVGNAYMHSGMQSRPFAEPAGTDISVPYDRSSTPRRGEHCSSAKAFSFEEKGDRLRWMRWNDRKFSAISIMR